VPAAAQSGVVAMAAGPYHTVALKEDGSVFAWGLNTHGQTTVPHIAQLGGVVAVAAGDEHTVVLTTAQVAFGWGQNFHGQTAAETGVVAIAAGGDHTVALKADGSVRVWGLNQWDQKSVPSAAQSGVVAIATSSGHTVALKADGSVVAWGANFAGQANVPATARSGVKAIAAGGAHTVALKSDGSVVAWGYNSYGQTDVPTGARSGVVAIAAGGQHTVALKADGSVIAWGAGASDTGSFPNYGQALVPETAKSGVVAISAAGEHTMALVHPPAPAITASPTGQTVAAGQIARFTVSATGLFLSYQWRKDGVDILGATGATYSLVPTGRDHAGTYTVVVSNPGGSVTSSPPALLTVKPPLDFIWTADANLIDDFSTAQNPHGLWAYGYAATLGGPMTLFPVFGDTGSFGDSVTGWYDPAAVDIGGPAVWKAGGELWFRPGYREVNGYGVIRFMVPVDGLYTISATLNSSYDFSEVGVHVLYNVTKLLSASKSGTYQGTVAAKTGDVIDLAVGPGGGYATTRDATLVSAVISLLALPDSPVLQVERTGDGLTLYWPVAAEGFVLQDTTNLAAPDSWADVPQTPVVVNQRNTVTEDTAPGPRFFRLHLRN